MSNTNQNITPQDDTEYIVPVSWAMYSTVVVKGAKSLQDAIDKVREYVDDLPLPDLNSNAEYIDDSYSVDVDSAKSEDAINAQHYHTKGVLMTLDGENKPDIVRL